MGSSDIGCWEELQTDAGLEGNVKEAYTYCRGRCFVLWIATAHQKPKRLRQLQGLTIIQDYAPSSESLAAPLVDGVRLYATDWVNRHLVI